MKTFVKHIILESVTLADRGDPSRSQTIEFALSPVTADVGDFGGAMVRLCATSTGPDRTLSITYAAAMQSVLGPGESLTDDWRREVMTVAGSVLVDYCCDLITHLTLRSRTGPWVVGPVDVDQLVRESPVTKRPVSRMVMGGPSVAAA